MKNILILGGTGFIGVNLISYFSKYGTHTITVASSHVPKHSIFPENIVHKTIDITDKNQVEEIIQGQDIIINLVGYSGAISSLNNPETAFQVNTIGHINVLEACRTYNPQATIIFASSRLEYGIPSELPVREDMNCSPHTIYGISKYTASKYSIIYNQAFGLKTVVFRISNPFGSQLLPTHTSYNLINHFIYNAIQNKPLTIYGDGSQLRDYIYIDDLCEIFWKAIDNDACIGTICNLGSGQPISLKDMAETIIRTVGKGSIEYKPWPEDWKMLETGDFYFTIDKTKQLFDWSPHTSLEEGIRKTIFY